jgi:hypothetical protein
VSNKTSNITFGDVIVTRLGVRCEMSGLTPLRVSDVKSSSFCNPKEQDQDDNKKMILKKI